MADGTRSRLAPFGRGSYLRQVGSRNSYAGVPIVLVIGLFVVNIVIQPQFAYVSNWPTSMAVLFPYVGIGMAFALPALMGGFDLSVGPLAGFMTIMVATVLLPNHITNPFLVIPIVIAFGLISGAITGFLVAYMRLPAIITTLGMYLFYEGLGTQVQPEQGGTVPVWLEHLVDGSYGPIPAIWVVIVALAAIWTVISKTAYFRSLLAIGGDERAAYTAGVNVAAVRLVTYSLTGALACITGLMLAGLVQSGDGTVGPPYSISAITAVALGGISLFGGRGGLLGGALGGVVLFLIAQLLTDAHVSVYAVSIIDGLMLIVALGLNGTVEVFRRRLISRGPKRSLLLEVPEELGALAPDPGI